MSATISTHVLDTSTGTPARGVAVTLDRKIAGGAWARVGSGDTDADGRLKTLVPAGERLDFGTYKLTFDTGAYAHANGTRAFFPEVSIVFDISDAKHHHVPLLLSPFGYSTYRGS